MPPGGIIGAGFSSGLSEIRASVVRIIDAIEAAFSIAEAYVDMLKAGIIDPAKVTRSAIENAASIASMILTTEALISDRPEEKPAPMMPPGGMGGMDY